MNPAGAIVFDTNVVISAALKPRSVPAAALSAALDRGHLVTCGRALDELSGVLQRRKFDRFAPRVQRLAVLALVEARATLVTVRTQDFAMVQGACRDPDDELFLALAFAADAKAIVSGDDDLLTLSSWRGVVICTPAQYLAQGA